jgi:hypothetical protein
MTKPRILQAPPLAGPAVAARCKAIRRVLTDSARISRRYFPLTPRARDKKSAVASSARSQDAWRRKP